MWMGSKKEVYTVMNVHKYSKIEIQLLRTFKNLIMTELIDIQVNTRWCKIKSHWKQTVWQTKIKNEKFNENTSVRYWILIFYFNLHKNMIHVQLHTIPLWMFNLFLNENHIYKNLKFVINAADYIFFLGIKIYFSQ